jgi:hypothetical protein
MAVGPLFFGANLLEFCGLAIQRVAEGNASRCMVDERVLSQNAEADSGISFHT